MSPALSPLANAHTARYHILWHDAETAVLMWEHGIRRNGARATDLARFSLVAVVDPLTTEP